MKQTYDAGAATELIARAAYAELNLPLPAVEKNHALLPEGNYTLEDLKSIGREAMIGESYFDQVANPVYEDFSLSKSEELRIRDRSLSVIHYAAGFGASTGAFLGIYSSYVHGVPLIPAVLRTMGIGLLFGWCGYATGIGLSAAKETYLTLNALRKKRKDFKSLEKFLTWRP